MVRPIGRLAVFAAAAVIVLLHLALVLDGATRHSAVFDEVIYPTAGYSYLTTGDYRMNPEHPPLLKIWAALPWIGSGLAARETAGWEEKDQWRFGRSLLYGPDRDPAALLLRARAMIALLSAGLAIGVFAVARKLGGDLAALSALALYSLDPLVVAHAGFATLDLGGAAFFFLATVAMAPALEMGGARRTTLAGVLLGCALASRFTTLPIFGVLALVAVWIGWSSNVAKGVLLRRAALVAGIGLLVVVASYGPAGPAACFEGLGIQLEHKALGHAAYAFGRVTDQGWWWYFIAAWAVKTPIVILAASLAGIGVVLSRVRRGPPLLFGLAVAPAFVLLAAIASMIDLGVRHLLPVTPFLAVMGGLAAAWLGRLGAAARVALGACLVWLAVATLTVHPDELAYANEPSGGPSNLWRLLADSSVDWGQDLPALAREVGKQPLRKLYLGYFGTADPHASGLVYHWIPSMPMIEKRYEDGPDPAGREWIAVSVTSLVEVYSTSDHEAYRWLRERAFTAFPGRSIALFDITGDAVAHRKLGEVAMRFGEVESAEAPLRRAVELAPGDGEARLDLARVLAARSMFREAAEQCVEAERLRQDAQTRATCATIRESGG